MGVRLTPGHSTTCWRFGYLPLKTKARVWAWLSYMCRVRSTAVINSRFVGEPREHNMLKGHLPRVIYHQLYQHMRNTCGGCPADSGAFDDIAEGGGEGSAVAVACKSLPAQEEPC